MPIDSTKLYGLLHETSGLPRNHQVKILRVAIGAPKGPDVHAFIDSEGKWTIERGYYEGKKRTPKKATFATRADAEAAYREARKSGDVSPYPRKFAYFTFLKMRSDGQYSADFAAIEQHGSYPTEVDVVFLANEPMEAEYQWWTAAELKCHGDGLNAERRLDLAASDAEKKLVEIATAEGSRFFAIERGCFAAGCKHAKGEKPVCKPHTRLYFQLLNSPRIGGSCTFETTGFRSTSQLFSCIRQIKSITGRGDPERGTIAGIPLKLVLRPYRTSHNGQPSIQYGVSLEARDENVFALLRKINASADEFQEAARLQAPLKQISGAPPVESEPDVDADAPAMAAEFYHVEEDEDAQWEGQEEAAGDSPAQTVREPRRKSETEGAGK
jgi:hypothetical protein